MQTTSAKHFWYAMALGLVLSAVPGSGTATSVCGDDTACKLFLNLATVPPTSSELTQMKKIIQDDGHVKAALWVMSNSKEFYTVQVKEFAEPWSHKDGKLGAVLDETSATIMLAIKENIDFRRIMWDDLIAKGNGEVYGQAQDQLRLPDGTIIEGYLRGQQGARHYADMEDNEVYHKDGYLIFDSQLPTTFPSDQPGAPAGILSTFGFGNAAYLAGTNRRAIPMITREAWCVDLEDLRDQTSSEEYIRRDVIRKDSDGTSTTYKSVCKTCHGFMDSVSAYSSFYDVQNGAVVYTNWDDIEPSDLAEHLADHKILRENGTVGYIPKKDQWFLNFTDNQKRLIGIPKNSKSGFGAKSFGKFISSTGAFAKCQPQKAFKAVCGHMPRATDKPFIKDLIRDFVSNGYKMKEIFAKSAIYCAGVPQ